ncbi:MAG TPA: type II secretion system protein N [Gammaproteobacteria bacterium]
MKTAIQLTLLGLAAFLVFLLISAPAAILTKAVEHYTPARFQNVSGTVWRGAADRFELPGASMGPVTWTIKPAAFLRGVLSATLQVGTEAQASELLGSASLEVGLSGVVTVTQAHANVDAAWAFMQAAVPIAATGELELAVEQLVLDPQKPLPKVHAELQWLNAGVNYPNVYDLGGYRLLLDHQPEDEPQTIVGAINDIDSPLKINGTVELDSGYNYTLNANVSTTPAASPDIQRVLPLLGNQKPDGSVDIRRQGNLKSLL